MDSRENEVLVEKFRAHLDESLTHIDGATLSRLTQARHAALEQAVVRPYLRWRAPLGGLAGAAVLSLALFVGINAPQVESPSLAVADFEMLASVEGPDLYDNLEFYQWLEAELDEAG